jgi:short-subunit dehydrogenase
MANDGKAYRTAVVTGASSGIGRALSVWLARRGIRVFAAARRLDALRKLQAEVSSAPGKLEPIEMDVAKARETIQQIQELDDASGGLDLIIANAGVGIETPAKRIQWDRVEQTIQVNVLGASATLCAVLPRMVERNSGHLVGISSLAAFRGLPRHAAYSASKAFLATFLEGLRVDLQSTAAKVTSVYPGFVKSEMTAKNKFKMPFLMETDQAVDAIGEAIMRGQSAIAFPWQMALVSRVLRLLPNSVFDIAAKKM